MTGAVRLAAEVGRSRVRGRNSLRYPRRGFRFPVEIIAHAASLCPQFTGYGADPGGSVRGRQLCEYPGLGHPFWPAICRRTQAAATKG